MIGDPEAVVVMVVVVVTVPAIMVTSPTIAAIGPPAVVAGLPPIAVGRIDPTVEPILGRCRHAGGPKRTDNSYTD